MRKILSVMLSVACLMQCCWFTVAKAEGFSDISGHWAEEAIVEMAEKGYATGNEAGEFMPDATITRGEFYTLLARYACYSTPGEFTAEFRDMDGTEWYAPYVQFSYERSYIPEGITREKVFNGDEEIKREEIAVAFVLLEGDNSLVTVQTTLYDDYAELSDWAVRPIAVAIAKGYIQGTDATHLSPQKTATRAEAVTMLKRVMDVVGEITHDKLGESAATIGESEYGPDHPDNYIVNDYSDTKLWNIVLKPGTLAEGYAEGTVTHLQGDGSTPEDGCVYYNVENTGRQKNALQMKYELHTPNAVEKGRKYKVGFKAKLIDGTPTDDTLKVNVLKFRDVDDNNIVWSNVVDFDIIESDEWLNYEIELTGNDTQDVVVLIWQFGGDSRNNIEVYFDDFYWIPMEATGENNSETLKNINTIIASDTDPADVQITGGGDMDFDVHPTLSATTTKESGLLLDCWLDPYRNKISPNSVYTAPANKSYTYRASFAPYDYEDKGFNVPVSDVISVTTEVPAVNGTTASVNGKVTLPEGYSLLDAGTLFYGGYWTENFNLFSENIKTIPACNVSETGEFASQAFMNTRYGVLARTYAIIENPEGNVMVQYSDTEYMHSPSRPEKIEHHGIIYHELLGLFTGSNIISAERGIEMVDGLAQTGADIITCTPSAYKLNVWNSTTDGYWSDAEKYEGSKSLHYAQKVKDYVHAGGDAVQDAIDGARKNNMYLFIDQRMNDHHNNTDIIYNTHSWFFKNNPQYWRQDRDTTYSWNETPLNGEKKERLFNYMNPEVRDYFYTLIEELVSTYDVDGVQMDFDRYYIYFLDEETEMGENVLTEFVGRVREMVNRYSIDRNKDLQVSVRLNDPVSKVNGYGMDVEEWCRRDYVDILNVGDHYVNHMTIDIEGFKALAHKAKVYAELHYLTYEGASVGGTSNHVERHVTEHVSYATAKNFYDRGADGISFFNFQYCPDPDNLIYPKLPVCFDRKALETAEKNYVFPRGKGDFGFGFKSDLDYTFVIGEEPSNHSYIVARIEYAGDATAVDTTFTLNGTVLNEIERQEVEMFPAYSSGTQYATAAQCKYFEIPLNVFINGENHFVIDSENNGNNFVASMDIAFYN